MKQARLVENEHIDIVETTLDKPAGSQVKVKVTACGICGSDIPRYFDNGARHYPVTLGHEFCGEVLETGERVTSLKVGDMVVGVPLVPCFECDDCKAGDFSLCKNYRFIGSSLDGAFCEEMMIDERNLFKIDKAVASKYCALFEPSTIAVHAVKMYSNYENKKVAVVGGGTIGEFLCLWSKIYGAKEVVLFVRRRDNDETYHHIGIENVELSNADSIKTAKEKYTCSKGFDIVFDATGNNQTILASLDLACNHSNVCLVGTPVKPVMFEKRQWETINRKELMMTGTWMSYSNPFPGEEWRQTEQAIKEGKLVLSDDFFAGEFALVDINDAFSYIKNGKNGSVGRVLIVMNKN